MNLVDAARIGIVLSYAWIANVPAIFTGSKNHETEGTPMKVVLKRLWNEHEGQDLTEYALLLVLISFR